MFGMQLKRIELIQKIISVCCMLHNICIDMGDADVNDLPLPLPLQADMVDEQPVTAPELPPQHGQRQIARSTIVAVFAERSVRNRLQE